MNKKYRHVPKCIKNLPTKIQSFLQKKNWFQNILKLIFNN